MTPLAVENSVGKLAAPLRCGRLMPAREREHASKEVGFFEKMLFRVLIQETVSDKRQLKNCQPIEGCPG
jgi:hypothetical protein